MQGAHLVAAACIVMTPALAQSVDVLTASPPSKLVPVLLGVGIGVVVGFSIVAAMIILARRRRRRAKLAASIAHTSVSSTDQHPTVSRHASASMAKPSRHLYASAVGTADVISLGHRARPDASSQFQEDKPPHLHYSIDIHATLRSSNPTLEVDDEVPILGAWADDEVDSMTSSNEDGHQDEHTAVYGALVDDRRSMVVVDPSETMRDGFYL